MEKVIHGIKVRGCEIGPKSECKHWHSDRDIVAIKFYCCQEFYCCYDCHQSIADHPPQTWPIAEHDELAILCGYCGHQLTVQNYQSAQNKCPACQALFNPGCRTHAHLYFETN
jgi:uncharacterized CHY-type Zn-finger protein